MNYKKIILIVITFLVLIIFFQRTDLKIYSISNDDKLQIHSSIKVLKISPTDKKLSKLASALSKEIFSGKKIILVKIKSVDGKEIAYFDLQDKNEPVGSPLNWNQSFQGSSGAYNTLTSITETLLQKDFPKNWIDGINLTYNGEYVEFDHISFDDTIYWRN